MTPVKGASNESARAEQDRAPFHEAMMEVLDRNILPFDTPGHRQGRGMPRELHAFFTELGAAADVSLMESLGTPEEPAGALAEAERLAAAFHGADAAVFSVNGTTALIHAMLLGTLCPGDAVLLPRNVHRSVTGGVILAGLVPIYMEPVYDARFGIPHGVSPDAVASALAAHPEARAVLLVSPTYYGAASDLAAIADIVHRAGRLLLVDEAHGAHLCLSDRLPMPAMEAGADMAAQSTHKLTGSLTQTSTLLLRRERVDEARVRRASALLQSTSPNGLLLASLDAARRQMAVEGPARAERAVELALRLRQSIRDMDGLRLLETSHLDGAGAYALDVLKLTVNVSELGFTGRQAADFLLDEAGIAVELADARNILCIISYADTEETAARLLDGLRALCRQRRSKPAGTRCASMVPTPQQILTPREAFFAPTESVSFREAEGRVAGETLLFYPPGIPLVCAGERLSGEVLDALRLGMEAGLAVHGASDAGLNMIKVIVDV
ncbi:aminotransferase class I/II-fold pyridoxal phosphate-dependent enzyme [Selenomonas sp. TAMA-11512]|uniref:aminotransferase class I/II-fold pyridoxal phosphate-dependent enzyme n=1 Tax=Selenomonas sp. TAMA-11512 TaxID=3095337 RepID=UPI00308F7CD8|nr:aminotransferase class I/II-fold pyridoxal phosphate-dependent enzyme [Selenomonas sp. TAMA-11512]